MSLEHDLLETDEILFGVFYQLISEVQAHDHGQQLIDQCRTESALLFRKLNPGGDLDRLPVLFHFKVLDRNVLVFQDLTDTELNMHTAISRYLRLS